jgi:hypothetical protein
MHDRGMGSAGGRGNSLAGPLASLISLPGGATPLCRARMASRGRTLELWTRIRVCFWCVLVMEETTEVLVAPSHAREREPAQPTNKGVVDADPACLPACLPPPCLRPCLARSPSLSSPRENSVRREGRRPLGGSSTPSHLFDPSTYSRSQWRLRWLGLGGCVRAPAPARPVNMAWLRADPAQERRGVAAAAASTPSDAPRTGPPGPGERERCFTGTPEQSRVTCPPWKVTSLSRVCFARRREVETWRRDEVR